MTGALAELGLLITAWATFAVVTSLAVTLAWRLGAGRLRRAHPRFRAGAAWAAAVSPSLVPTLLVLLCLAPGLAGLLGGPGDHCLRHGGHPHLCLVHLPSTLRAPLVAILLLGAGGLAVALRRGGARVAESRRLLTALSRAARKAADPDVNVVASARPFSFTAGVLRHEVWIASSLVEALSRDQLAVVLEHERAHLERRDPLRGATAAALSWPLWPSVRRAVLAELELASEQACDEAAGQRLGDRLRVAETILAVERLVGAAASRAPAAAVAFGGSNVRARVQSLLAEPRSADLPFTASRTALVAVLGALSLSADPLHHVTEHWIRLLLGLG